MIIQVIAAFAAIFTFAMALEIPKKYLINCGFIGAAGWFVYLVVLQRFGMMTANLLGAAAACPFFCKNQKSTGDDFFDPGVSDTGSGGRVISQRALLFYRKSKHGSCLPGADTSDCGCDRTWRIYGRFPCGDHWKKKTKRREKQSESGKKIAGAAWDCTCIIEKR